MDSSKDDRWIASNLPKSEFRHFPNEVMLKVLLSRNYTRGHTPITPGLRVLDIGCFHINNLVPFHDRGCECHGVELNADMVAAARRAAERNAMSVEIKEGNNRALPYADASFDLLLSINTVHYESSLARVGEALAEFRRVLKPTGRAFIMTHGPQHFIQTTAKALPENRIEVGPIDFREGTIQTAFSNTEMLAATCAEQFSCVETGSSLECYPTKNLHFLWSICS